MVASKTDETVPVRHRRVFPSVSHGLRTACDDPYATCILGSRAMKGLVPQKRVAALLGVSRSSLWRASRSGIQGFLAPTIVGSRVYWREKDLPALKAALDRFPGRKAFEQERRHARARAALAQAVSGRAKKRKPASPLRQPDLFGEPDVVAPGGAEPSPSGRGHVKR